MKVNINQRWPIVILIVSALIFFYVYSSLAFYYIQKDISQNLIFNSPDETANYYFAYNFYKHSQLQFNDPANALAEGLISPRSMMVIEGQTVPVSFVGLPLIAGLAAVALGPSAIFFIVPFFSCLSVIFFYLLLKEFFSHQTSWLAAMFLLIQPAWWYYSVKGLVPNVLFLSFLIMAFFFLVKSIKSGKIRFYLLFGLFFGLSLIVRTSEITWLLPLLFILIIINWRRVSWPGIVLSGLISMAAYSPVIYFNYQNFHSFFSFAYAADLQLTGKNILSQGLNVFEKIILPFGFHPRTALISFYNYSFKIFPVWSALSVIGLLIFSCLAFVRKEKAQIIYVILFLFISGYLVLYYGSWVFNDNPDPFAITIGNSYVRYWLPIYVLALPFLTDALWQIFKKSKLAMAFLAVTFLVSLASMSYGAVYLGRDEGLKALLFNLKKYETIQSAVNARIESRAIIIADRLDKVFFPRHSVIFRLNNDSDYRRVNQLISGGYPVYYFYFSRPPSELEELNERYFKPHNLEVLPSMVDFSEQSLYPVKIWHEQQIFF